jgi:hypothetical protein
MIMSEYECGSVPIEPEGDESMIWHAHSTQMRGAHMKVIETI